MEGLYTVVPLIPGQQLPDQRAKQILIASVYLQFNNQRHFAIYQLKNIFEKRNTLFFITSRTTFVFLNNAAASDPNIKSSKSFYSYRTSLLMYHHERLPAGYPPSNEHPVQCHSPYPLPDEMPPWNSPGCRAHCHINRDAHNPIR